MKRRCVKGRKNHRWVVRYVEDPIMHTWWVITEPLVCHYCRKKQETKGFRKEFLRDGDERGGWR